MTSLLITAVNDIYNIIGNLIFGDEYKYIKNKTEDNDTPKSQYIHYNLIYFKKNVEKF